MKVTVKTTAEKLTQIQEQLRITQSDFDLVMKLQPCDYAERILKVRLLLGLGNSTLECVQGRSVKEADFDSL